MTTKWKTLLDFHMSNLTFCYHYSRMEDRQKKAYEKLAEGLLSYRKSILVCGITPDQLKDLFSKMKLDMPVLFFLNELKMVWNPILRTIKVLPQYWVTYRDAEAMLEAMQQRVWPLLKQCEGAADLDCERLIHDWLCSNVIYDNDYNLDLGGPSFEMSGPLLYGKGVCSGISKAAKFMFDLAGIRSLVLEGEITVNRNPDPAKNLHAWNMVEVREAGYREPQRYHLDITYDMTLHTKRYFNLNRSEILADRRIT